MRLIVTGAAGILGSELITQTIRCDAQTEILAVTREPQALAARWQDCDRVKCCAWSEVTPSLFEDGDIIVHGAFPRQEVGQELAQALALTSDLLKAAG